MILLKKTFGKMKIVFTLSLIFTLMFSMNAFATYYGTADLERDSYFYAPGNHWIRMIANIHVNYAYDEGAAGWIDQNGDNYTYGDILSNTAVIDDISIYNQYYTDSTFADIWRVNYIDGWENYTVDIHIGAGCNEWGDLSTFSNMYSVSY